MATTPLIEMNRHLLVRSNRYAEFRRSQLEHHNLWSEPKWGSALLGAGFAEVTVVPYLSGAACKSWDRLDVIGTFGHRPLSGRCRRAQGRLPDRSHCREGATEEAHRDNARPPA